VLELALRITPGSPEWPASLAAIEAAPRELWIRGRRDLLAREPRVAIVGTRSPTPYGDAQARRFARALAGAGAVVVSGLARGIDGSAHAAALDAGGATIAVLGCGVDRPWPAGELADRVAREGLFVSEFAPGEPPRRHHFPLRNRLISGFSRAVVVVEAAYASGSLITARWAADQGVQVFAIPGRVDHPMAAGCHRLIREGASLVEDPEEVLAEIGLATRGQSSTDRDSTRRLSPAREAAGSLAQSILAALKGETESADEISERLAAPHADVLTELVELELSGHVVRGAGALYRLA
jgi:DNA processing protein